VHAPDLLCVPVEEQREPIHRAGVAAHHDKNQGEESDQNAHPEKNIHCSTPLKLVRPRVSARGLPNEGRRRATSGSALVASEETRDVVHARLV
jgi:hypothetical protein